jgi:hypothetical protein
MEKTINEKFIKISSRLPVSREFELGNDIILRGEGQEFTLNVVKTEDYDLQDGTINRVYTLKSLSD